MVKPGVYPYEGKMGQIVNVTPPHFRSNTVTVYTIQFKDGGIDDFVGHDLKTPTPEQSRKFSMGCLEEGFAIAEQLFRKGAKEAEHSFLNKVKEAFENTSVEKDVDWSDFKTEADKEWESFVK